ncbi:MAG: hypothetical protein OIF51_15985 [Cellvibrionaceae bacterium]|nr:hypothetical protein [Cellvibrionaceae bacterium]
MKVFSSIFIALSLLSLVLGISYLVVGHNPSTADTVFPKISGYIQIAVALLVLFTAVAFKKNGSKFKVAFLGSVLLYPGFIIYVLQ